MIEHQTIIICYLLLPFITSYCFVIHDHYFKFSTIVICYEDTCMQINLLSRYPNIPVGEFIQQVPKHLTHSSSHYNVMFEIYFQEYLQYVTLLQFVTLQFMTYNS